MGAPDRQGEFPRPPREVTKDHPSADTGAYDAAQGIDDEDLAEGVSGGSTSSTNPGGSAERTRRKKLGLEQADYQIGRGSISPLASRS